jgi:hypothetical protein
MHHTERRKAARLAELMETGIIVAVTVTVMAIGVIGYLTLS